MVTIELYFSPVATSMVPSSSKVTVHSEQKNAAGGMYIIMGFLWLIGIPIVVVAIVMVRIAQDLVIIICVYC